VKRVPPFEHRPQESETEDETDNREYDGEDTNWMTGEVSQPLMREICADCHVRSIDHSDNDATDIPKQRMTGDAMDRP
jgi:hypothetical protein